jgi:hypothetical protein
VIAHAALHLAVRNHALAAAGMPALVAFENVVTTPTARTPYVAEEYLPGGSTTITIGSGGTLRATPIYVLRCYGVPGIDVAVLRGFTDTLLAHFRPGTSWSIGAAVLRVRSDVAPSASALTQTDDGWAVITCSVPLEFHTPNS